MGNRIKLLQIGMWALVILSILLFVIIIIIGHTNSFDFIYSQTGELEMAKNSIGEMFEKHSLIAC